jgi:hypothetical protein
MADWIGALRFRLMRLEMEVVAHGWSFSLVVFG